MNLQVYQCGLGRFVKEKYMSTLLNFYTTQTQVCQTVQVASTLVIGRCTRWEITLAAPSYTYCSLQTRRE